ncbi:MAG: hypothetical protein IJV13_03100, partial [Prevotella sp.]|nr:hypothetical protein [Prevotella sp.]
MNGDKAVTATATGSVTPATTGRTSANNWVPTDGYVLQFIPSVNGFLSLRGHFYGGTGGSYGALVKTDG